MPYVSRSLRIGVAALVVVACGYESTSPKRGRAASMQIVSGDLQSGPVGTELPDPLVVKVLDSAG